MRLSDANLHPAFLRLLKSAVDGARKAGRPIAVCGDMAGDPDFDERQCSALGGGAAAKPL